MNGVSNPGSTSVLPLISSAGKAQMNREDQSLAKLKQATTDFEAIFIGEILKEMHSDASKGGLFGNSFEMGTYREMYDEAIAQQLAKSGILGIGKMLYQELAPAVKEETR